MSTSQVALITGAANGIGKDAAFNFAKRGYNLALIDLDKKSLSALEETLKSKCSITIKTFALDVGNPKLIEQCAEDVLKEFKRVDILFNNAGVFIPGLLNVDDVTAEKIIHTNLLAGFYLIKTIAPSMKQQKSGYILILDSIAGKHADPQYGIYAMTKFGLLGFAEALYNEMMPYNVKVTSICPSVVNTNMTKDFDVHNNDKIQTDDIISTINYLLELGANALVKEVVIDCKKAALEGSVRVPSK